MSFRWRSPRGARSPQRVRRTQRTPDSWNHVPIPCALRPGVKRVPEPLRTLRCSVPLRDLRGFARGPRSTPFVSPQRHRWTPSAPENRFAARPTGEAGPPQTVRATSHATLQVCRSDPVTPLLTPLRGSDPEVGPRGLLPGRLERMVRRDSANLNGPFF